MRVSHYTLVACNLCLPAELDSSTTRLRGAHTRSGKYSHVEVFLTQQVNSHGASHCHAWPVDSLNTKDMSSSIQIHPFAAEYRIQPWCLPQALSSLSCRGGQCILPLFLDAPRRPVVEASLSCRSRVFWPGYGRFPRDPLLRRQRGLEQVARPQVPAHRASEGYPVSHAQNMPLLASRFFHGQECLQSRLLCRRSACATRPTLPFPSYSRKRRKAGGRCSR